MPELPEVETIRIVLREGREDSPSILNKRIHNVQVLWERTIEKPAMEEFRSRIKGQVIQDVRQRGKFLHILLTDDSLLIHLRMSGEILVEHNSTVIGKHYRMIVHLDDHLRLSFSDMRKFGRVWLVSDPEEIFCRLGPEPLDPSFTGNELYRMLHKYHRQLKPLLMDQTFIAGLGNIFTDEALHRAKLHPRTNSQDVNETQSNLLLGCIQKVLLDGIRYNGASIDWVYRGGDFQNYFRVYQRTGESCPECGTEIERLVVGQRGTHVCPVCQPEPQK